MKQNNFHGSDIETIEKIFNVDKNNIINFASNVNPKGIPESVKKAIYNNIDCLANYPNRENSVLKSSIAKYVKSDEENIAVGNGVSEVLKSFVKAINPKNTLIIGPTYSEFAKEVSAVGSKVSYYDLLDINDFKLDIKDFEKSLQNDFDLLIICNPNNPTSTYLNNDILVQIIDTCKRNNIFVLIDETYIEFVENYESAVILTNNTAYDNLVVLRGISKFFALPGLRFGFGVTNNEILLESVSNFMNVWSVNSLVEVSVEALTNDKTYIKETEDFIFNERERIIENLSKLTDLKTFEPKANFVLIKIINDKTSDILFEKAIMQGLMIRNCESFSTLNDKFFRFCFLNKEENDKLLNFLYDEFN